MDVFAALRIATKSEVGAQRMYEKLAAEASDDEVKSLFKYLAEYEVMHQQFLEAERKALENVEGSDETRPSHLLGLMREELKRTQEKITPAGNASEEDDLSQMRLSLSAARGVAKVLSNANRELSEKQARVEQELAFAADIQKRLLPQVLPQDTGLQIAATNVMARSVGGDYYDFIKNEHGQLALVVADSMGKGVPAALLMTTIRAVWQRWSVSGSRSPGETLEMVSRVVYPDLKANEAFVTMFSAVYDPSTSVFEYSNAGHNPPIFRSAATSVQKELSVGSTPIGLFSDFASPCDKLSISKGDLIVIYTDGIVEAEDENEDPFGVDRLHKIIDRNYSSDATGVRDAILSEVDSYTRGLTQADDITIVVLKKA